MNIERLDSDLTQAICQHIEQGAFVSVAAGAVGITPYMLTRWLRRGQREYEHRVAAEDAGTLVIVPLSRYEQLYRGVEQAKAKARLQAETQVFQTAPHFWLTRGYARSDWRAADSLDSLLARLAALEEQVAEVNHRRVTGPDR